jgi:CheY-like chemotaxis protein
MIEDSIDENAPGDLTDRGQGQKNELKPIDLMLIDYLMPKMNGDEVIRQIRQFIEKINQDPS